MILLHGSFTKFNKFKIGEEYLRFKTSELTEGIGVYLTDNIEKARAYGDLIYEVEVKNEDVSDFTDIQVIIDLINNISKDVNVEIMEMIDIDDLFNGISTGNISTVNMYKEICNLLDSQESFYSIYGNKVTYEDDCIFKQIEESFYKNIKDVIKYHDSDLDAGIFICFRNPEILKIINVKKIKKLED